MRQRINLTLALTLSFIMGASPLLSVASGRNSTKTIDSPKTERSRPLPRRAKRTPRQPLQTTAQPEGQTTTQLPDGRLLLIGGMGPDGPLASVTISNPVNGESIPLPDMPLARAWHSATMLPDARVLIIGGIGPKGQILKSVQIFDPDTRGFQTLPKTGLSARAYHSATLLTDGRVLVVGGESREGGAVAKAEVWDFKSKAAQNLPDNVSVARQKHKATLLSDGNVLIEGGIDQGANPLQGAELFNVEAGSFSFTSMSSSETDGNPTFLAASIPRDSATDVSLDSIVTLRFSKPLDVASINSDTVKLSENDLQVPARVTPAEHGRLAFVTPLEPLHNGATYTVVLGATKDAADRVTPATVSFTTVSNKKDEDKPTQTNQPTTDADWLPDAESLRGNWKSRLGRSSWQDKEPLKASPGETAVSGQVLTLRGQPLADVILKIGSSSTQTDQTGRFLIRSLAAGHQVMLIDGRSAGKLKTVYGLFRVGVEVAAGQTNVLSYTIWMPKLDMAHAVTIPSPNKRELVITTPLIPGLELHLPPGTVIRDVDGRPVTEISITPVPTDRPPFPLPPGLKVPVFASIQPGGSRVIPPRARLIYPNYTSEPPGARVNFWNYDPEGKGWYIYGQGTVSSSGLQIVPDAGVAVYEFNGIMIGSQGNPPGNGREPGDNDEDGDPVDLSTGLFVWEKTDLVLPDTIPLALKRTYRPGDNQSRSFGIGATHPYEMFLWSVNNYQEADLILPDGGRIHYARVSPGTGFQDAIYEHTSTPTAFYKSQMSWNGSGWDITLKDGTVLVFGEYAPLQAIRDRYGNQVTITRAGGQFGNTTQVTSPNGRWLQFTYDSSDRVTQAKDNSGRLVGYTYDSSGRLWKVTDPNGGITEYTYDSSHRMLTLKDARGIVYLTNQYDSNGRVISQTQADSSTYGFDYTLDAGGKVTRTDVTDPRGNVRRVTFNSNGYTVADTRALGTSAQQTLTFNRQSGTNLVLGVTDPLGRETAYAYDSLSNVTSITRLAGTVNAVATSLTYEPNYNQVASVTDTLNHTTSYAYDSKGNLISVTDPLSHQIAFAYNAAGQLISTTDPLNHTTQWTYESGDLASITNPLGYTTSRYVDSVGRPVRTTDSLGRATLYTYNALNQPTQVTDSLGGVTTFSYDPNGNVESVTDARSGVTSYTYDDMDRLETRTDPLQREESYEYDEAGNLVKFTDRRGKVASLSYDALDRGTFAGFGTVISGGTPTYASTITYTYDGVSRLTQAVDSLAGTISIGYDNLDRQTSETSPQGTVSYGYDAADRQTSTTVTGRSAVSYAYDNADRLTGIAQGTSSITYAYDTANRRTSLTLPNGLVTEYGYDVGSNLTNITYKQGATVLGDLTYAYDAGRRRTRMGGSYARTGLPQTLNSATYDAANQMTQRASTTLSHDDNGNLTSDGVDTYTWDARNRLTAISGGTSASFEYDAFGRRASKTVNSQTTDYLYDGLDIVQELSGGTPTANMLNGAGVDERHTCDCNGAPRTLLTDALGSAIALTGSTGAVQTEYTYDAFGATTTSGTASSNASQYTGRENDSTGLHYYRARYYSPVLQRFLSEDPLGFGGGDTNLYAYVGNSPTNSTDPSGNNPIAALGIMCLEGAIINASIDAIANTLAGRKVTLNGMAHSAATGCVLALVGFGLGKALGFAVRGLGRGARTAEVAGEGLGRCFVAGTLVKTEDGEKRIEDIAVGDVVLSADPSPTEPTTKLLRRAVTRTYAREAEVVFDIRIGSTTITATPEHPFWVVKQGWTAAGELRRGSALLTKDGVVVHVDSVERREGKFKVYNLEVQSGHTYFVGIPAVLVHNQCGALRRAIGREYPTKANSAGRQQPYDPTNGQYLPNAANTGFLPSPVGQLGVGLGQGYAGGITPGPPDLPPTRSGAQLVGQLIGYAVGYLFGPR